jgi:hypothetical protein
MIRGTGKGDLEKIKEIHNKFYSNEFNLPDFNKHFINSYVITNSDNNIVSVGGIRPILEVVAITDKDMLVKERLSALGDLLTISAFIAEHDGFDELHCFVQDEIWLKQLKKKGFSETKGKSLVFKI